MGEWKKYPENKPESYEHLLLSCDLSGRVKFRKWAKVYHKVTKHDLFDKNSEINHWYGTYNGEFNMDPDPYTITLEDLGWTFFPATGNHVGGIANDTAYWTEIPKLPTALSGMEKEKEKCRQQIEKWTAKLNALNEGNTL